SRERVGTRATGARNRVRYGALTGRIARPFPAGGNARGHLVSKGASPIGELEKRLRQQALLAEIGRRALADSSIRDLFAETCRLCAVGLDVRYCKILEYQPADNRFLVRAGCGWHEGVVGNMTVGADLESPAGYALHTGKPVIANRLSQETRFR